MRQFVTMSRIKCVMHVESFDVFFSLMYALLIDIYLKYIGLR